METRILNEGLAKIYVPFSKEFFRPDGKIEPAWMPYFYNPYSVISRDLTSSSVSVYSQLYHKVKAFVEPLAGSCVRIIRVILENGGDIYGFGSDIDEKAVNACLNNISLNAIGDKIKVEREDANYFMYKLLKGGIHADAVDIDPYGSPMPYIQPALRLLGKKGMLSVTATDLGALVGKYADVAARRYFTKLFSTDYSKEIAARALISAIAREAAMIDRLVKPLITFYHEHFLKIVFLVEKSKKGATKNIVNLGYLCLNEDGYPMKIAPIFNSEALECRKHLGPIWISEIWDESFVNIIKEHVSTKHYFNEVTRRKINEISLETKVKTVFYYNIDKICSRLKISVPSFSKLIQELESIGYKTSRTHFDEKGIRSEAPYDVVEKILKS